MSLKIKKEQEKMSFLFSIKINNSPLMWVRDFLAGYVFLLWEHPHVCGANLKLYHAISEGFGKHPHSRGADEHS